MKKSFVLMTRSYKYGGYCVAGFDTATKRWMRLVSSPEPSDNEIPKSVFDPFDDLDILEVAVTGEAPCGCQTENCVLDFSVPPRRVGKLSFYELLSPAYMCASPTIFGNLFSELSAEEIARQRTSLGLFEVQSLFFDFRPGDDGKRHYRCKFTYRGRQYVGISLTDPVYRKDGFAGETIEHALLAVSIPAIPYPNGKYYKFIAKIFPLSAEETARIETARIETARIEAARNEAAPAPISAPRPRIFARDYPDASGESLARAAQFLQSLAEGRDPDTNAVLDPVLVLSPSYAAWFRYCAAMMGKHPKKREKPFEKKRTYILRENIGKIQLTDEPVTVSKLSDRVNAVREPYGKKMTAVDVSAFFLNAGLIREEGSGRKYKAPTELGQRYGVFSEMRISMKGIRYFAVLYGRAAQQLFLDNLELCAEVLDAPLSVSAAEIERGDLPWTVEDDETLEMRFGEGEGIDDLVKEFGRTPNFIRKRLNALGLNAGTEERDRSWGLWNEEEQEKLVQEYASGLRLEEIAKAHKRSIVAITRRLKKLGIEV